MKSFAMDNIMQAALQRTRYTRKKQHGAVLVTSLIILMVLTVLGVSAFRTIGLEENMAGNMRCANFAFQAAESGLRNAENLIEGWVTLPLVEADDNSSQLHKSIQPTSTFVTQAHNQLWWDDNAQEYALPGVKDLANVMTDPIYVIESLKSQTKTDSLNPEDLANPKGIVFFRNTVRGIGLSANCMNLIQATYGKRFR